MSYVIEVRGQKEFFETLEDAQRFIEGKTTMEWSFRKTTPRAVLDEYAGISPDFILAFIDDEDECDDDKLCIQQIADAAQAFGGWDAEVVLISEPSGWTFKAFDPDTSLRDAIEDICYGKGWLFTSVDDED